MACYDPLIGAVCTRRDGSRFVRLGIQSGVALDPNGRPLTDSFYTHLKNLYEGHNYRADEDHYRSA